jgi:FixJ family two-component response regulator
LQTWRSPFKDTPIIPIIHASVNIIYHILWHHIFNPLSDFQKTTPIFITTYKIPTLLCCRRKAKLLKPLYPEIKILYMSGYTDDAIVHHGILEQGVDYIQKPFAMEGLATKVREVLDKDPHKHL